MKSAFVESRKEIEEILHHELYGFLGLSKDNEAYVVPVNFAYMDGKILIHCAHRGKKLDWIRTNPDVCFTVGWQTGEMRDHKYGTRCHMDANSVICYGRARIVEDIDERAELLNRFNLAFRPNPEHLDPKRARGCLIVEITISEMTGRWERNREVSAWRWRFGD